ncbi:MAG: Hsp70 family protein [Deltaproteobacteria bacterium]|jgi:molecular chaperone DnaK|nr:Hsp70 family protein [Deltaproteobacteria bacterium]
MIRYAGIDLGTTNSAIATFDGTDVRVWKSPEQNDVTPSVIAWDRRGNRFVGKRAYDAAPYSPDSSAMLFKRLMGTSTPVSLPGLGRGAARTPEECSAEVLKTLFGYLPEEVRNDPATGTVVTVPAAFNEMQKVATMQAASLAGLGRCALMQEPVAAVMSVAKAGGPGGVFLVYDLGGGTLDSAVAESVGGRVNLLAHGGVAMCGGRDFDRVIVDGVVRPWLARQFELPGDLPLSKEYRTLMRLCAWAAEKAKIELSSVESTSIALSESEARAKDLNGAEIFLDIEFGRADLDRLIEPKVRESVEAARETLRKAGISSQDLGRVVFIGGPTNYKPLRDRVCFELGVAGGLDVNPMTAVAEGAALFAESVDWESKGRGRKGSRGRIAEGGALDLSFDFVSRTPASKARIVCRLPRGAAAGAEFQVDSADTGWNSGRMPLSDGAWTEVALSKPGENVFRVSVFDPHGGRVKLPLDRVVVTRTAATVAAIPASHSIGVEVLERLGGAPALDWLVRAGDSLPKKGRKVFKAAEALKAGSAGSLNFNVWEGEIEDPVTDNRPVGVLKVTGSDFDSGAIRPGSELVCDFEVQDSGVIVLEVSAPDVGGTFRSGNSLYSRQEGQMDFMAAAGAVLDEASDVLRRVDDAAAAVNDARLAEARRKILDAMEIDPGESDPERAQEAREKVLEAKKILARVRKENLKAIREGALAKDEAFWRSRIKPGCRPAEIPPFESLFAAMRQAAGRPGGEFDGLKRELSGRMNRVLWRVDSFVLDIFECLSSEPPWRFSDQAERGRLAALGRRQADAGDMNGLRDTVFRLIRVLVRRGGDETGFDPANIIRG